MTLIDGIFELQDLFEKNDFGFWLCIDMNL
jgi:hypothetical protein